MSFPKAVFKVIHAENCPHYSNGDEFRLSDNALFLPDGKPACVILVLDITEVFLNTENIEKTHSDSPARQFKCLGCKGFIQLTYEKEAQAVASDEDDMLSSVASLLDNFSFFQSLNEDDVEKLVPLLKIKKFAKDEIVIKKGEPGRNLFIILSGKIEVVGDDGISIAFLEKGEVFGEMSLLSGDVVGATIKVVEPSTILYLNGKDFRSVLNKFPSLQMYFARLLAKRLAKTNVDMFEEFGSGMVGKLSEMPPVELFQTLNQNQKTGYLILNLSKSTANLCFKEGELIHAKYGKTEGKNAFFEILKERNGRFKFTPGLSSDDMKGVEIEDFMSLLMEGLSRMDESNAM